MDTLLLGLIPVGLCGLLFVTALFFRRVVSTNEVHIVQSAKRTTSYGKDIGSGNTYYEWPSWLPVLGVTKVVLPVSVFDLDLAGYEAYDKGRLPFVVDVKAFFRITDSNVAAQRVASFEELNNQLKAIVQGSVRVILASNDIETILQGRSTFGDQFTKEVAEQLTNWGVGTVKNIELMDIRDHKDSNVIRNIMEKRKSHIEMESRTEVAKNKRLAEIAEIEAGREISLQKQEAAQQVGLRTVESQKEVAVANEQMNQIVRDQQKISKAKEMDIIQVENTKRAEITRGVQVIEAEQTKQTTVLRAEGNLEAKKREAQGIALEGQAKADAEKAMQLAPVEAQIVLAKEIGGNESYQKYLITIRKVEAEQAVGMKQAEALKEAEVKIISNTGTPAAGLNSVRDLFSSAGGQQVGAMLEGLGQTDAGQAVLNKIGLSNGLNGSGGRTATKPVLNGAAK